ncbi:hypothetical protein Bhyg_14801, partial [Pseudolycoriella hygida]
MCDICKRLFETKRGLTNHRRTHDLERASQPTDPAPSASPTKNLTEVECNVCKQTFPTHRGMKTHRNRHAKEANEETAARINSRKEAIVSSDKNDTSGRISNDASKLESECKKWKDTFQSHLNNEVFNESEFDNDVTKFLKFLFEANAKMPGPRQKQRSRIMENGDVTFVNALETDEILYTQKQLGNNAQNKHQRVQELEALHRFTQIYRNKNIYECVKREDKFFDEEMKTVLQYFYNEVMLKELANSSKERDMQLRQYDEETKTFM